MSTSIPQSSPLTAGLPQQDPARLRGFEQVAVPLLNHFNTRSDIKRRLQFLTREISARWIRAVIGRFVEFYGLEHVRDLDPKGGVLLVANHRSFYDMYITLAHLYKEARFLDRIFFPVRSSFFYTNPLGVLINMGIAAGAMWPPIFRDDRRDDLNPVAMAQMVWMLSQPGALIGIHPEGTRNRNKDPWSFLPARPGVGQLVMQAPADTVVLPYFITGVTNSFFLQIFKSFLPRRWSGPPIRIRFCAPVRAGELRREADTQRIANNVMGMIQVQAEEDKKIYGAVS